MTELCADRRQTGGEIDELLFLPNGPVEAVANEGARDIDQTQTARLGEAKGRAIESARLVVERRFLGVLRDKSSERPPALAKDREP